MTGSTSTASTTALRAATPEGTGDGEGSRKSSGNGGPAAGNPPSAKTDVLACDICVIGAGSGGLSVAAAAAAFGQNVVLIEKGRMGGDCLNYGCVPSKALLAAAKRAHLVRTSAKFGIAAAEPDIDHTAVHRHVHDVIAAIEPNDSVARFTGMGVKVIKAAARFLDRDTVAAGEYRIKARRFVIATGSAPFVPPITGLDAVPHFTNETLFDNREKLAHLLVLGGGPIGLEMAQAHRRLGSRVTVIEAGRALSRDDPEMSRVVLEALRDEGIEIREGAKVSRASGTAGDIELTLETAAGRETVSGTHLLVAAGRRPVVEGLGLAEAGIKYAPTGIEVSKTLLTSNPKVFAIGDCIGAQQFTHVANYHAGIVIRRALFRLPVKVDETIIPWVTYTDPELAHVGLSETEAAARHKSVSVLRWPYAENDRAQAERTITGHVKVMTTRRGRILGATIVGPQAGELIGMWSLAVSTKMNIKAMTGWISPYPTLSEINKRAGYRFFATAPSSPWVRKAIGWLAKLG